MRGGDTVQRTAAQRRRCSGLSHLHHK
jgi:hypothetical protein